MKTGIAFAAALLLSFASAFPICASKPSGWAPVGDRIRTEWAEQVDPACPLPEYPRPRMVRSEWMNLNGLWDYAITSADAASFEPEGRILVPFPLESSLSGVGGRITKDDALWYSRSFTLPKSWKGNDVLLNFGAVDWSAEVWVNGKFAGKHTGGYTAFSFNITGLLNPRGRQTVTVKVLDATDNSYQARGKQWLDAGGIWYTPVSGIWQTVWLESVEKSHISAYDAVADLKSGCLNVSVDAVAAPGDMIRVEVLDGGLGYSAESPSSVVLASADAAAGETVALAIPGFRTWSPESPYLYGLRLTQIRDGKVLDVVNGYSAMRSVSAVTGDDGYRRIGLNGEPVFMFGPLDQGWWPDGLYTAPTDEALHFDIARTKDFGYNMIRKHVKVEPARWYYWADVEGICVWQDMPSIADYCAPGPRAPEICARSGNHWSGDTAFGGTECSIPQEGKDSYYHEWGEIIAEFKNNPCIVVWVPFNEAWGQFDTEEVVAFTRAQDPTRLINPASGGNFTQCGDIIDVHNYPAPRMGYYDRHFINVYGEFGGIGHPVEGHLWNSGYHWGYVEFATPDEVLDRYESIIEQMKLFKKMGYSAAVYTQTTDVEGEVNGLMTYDRKVIKVDEARLRRINLSLIEP